MKLKGTKEESLNSLAICSGLRLRRSSQHLGSIRLNRDLARLSLIWAGSGLNRASTNLFSIGQSPLGDSMTMLFDPFRDFKVVGNRVSYLPIIPDSPSNLLFVVKNWLSRKRIFRAWNNGGSAKSNILVGFRSSLFHLFPKKI
jgi:hypothetical protein